VEKIQIGQNAWSIDLKFNSTRNHYDPGMSIKTIIAYLLKLTTFLNDYRESEHEEQVAMEIRCFGES
jgi:hypothetical protein